MVPRRLTFRRLVTLKSKRKPPSAPLYCRTPENSFSKPVIGWLSSSFTVIGISTKFVSTRKFVLGIAGSLAPPRDLGLTNTWPKTEAAIPPKVSAKAPHIIVRLYVAPAQEEDECREVTRKQSALEVHGRQGCSMGMAEERACAAFT